MTRLAMEANFQYVPIAPDVVTRIATLVAPAPPTARLVDVCAGEGEAAAQLARAWGIDRDRLFLNELADGRTALCRRFTDHVLGADAIRSLQISRHSFQVAWTNPPFGMQPREQGGGRYEPLFFKRMVEEGRWLQPGGLHLMLAPQDVWLTNLGTLNHLARCYDQVTLLALPDEHRRYREVLVAGIVRSIWRNGTELKDRARLIAQKLSGDLPELTAQAEPRYHLPAPLAAHRKRSSGSGLVWRDANAATPEQAQADVLAEGGAWAARGYQARLQAARRDRRRIRPVFPLGKVAAALRVAEGDINNMPVIINDRAVRIKGGTRKTTRTWQEERTSSDGTVILDTHRMELREPVVVTLDQDSAAITRYSGDTGVATLMDIPDAAQSLLDAVAQSAPPVYTMQLPPAVEPILDTLVPASGRALPGYAPGFIPMQRHIIGAMITAFREPDPHTGKRRRVLGLSADMGCGKSLAAAGAAEVLRQLLPTNDGRAFTALVVAPNHLIGELAQMRAHEADPERVPLPQWIAEWRDLLPHWHSTLLETPAQVSAFYAGAQADPHTPRVGFIAFSRFSLGSGWEVAATTHHPAPPVPMTNPDDLTQEEQQHMARRAVFFERLQAEDQREWDELKQRAQARKKRARQAQRVARATGDTDPAPMTGPGVSARTIRRDRLFRCGTAHRAALNGNEYTPLWHFAGIYCPDCGRRVRNKDGLPHTHASLRRAGMLACPFCGGMLGQRNRTQDNVGDRELPIFTDPTYLHADATEIVNGRPRRIIPWGTRPTSNPRIALGDFLVTRGYARATDLTITDEFHGMKGLTSARGRIWGRLIAHAARSLGLTGSPYGGKASTAYWLLQRMANPFVRAEFSWNEEKAFVERMGIIDTITSQVVEEEAQAFSGKRNTTSVRVEERNGLTAELAAIMQSQFIFILLKQMGFLLPPYHEGVVFFDLPADLAAQYARLVHEGKAIIKEPGGKDALSSYLQSTLTYAMAPWKPVTVRSTHTGMAYRPPEFPRDTILPHHRWLAQHAAEQTRAGRGMLVFAEHTNRLDILDDLQAKITELAQSEHGTPVKVAILRSTTVKPGARGAWFAAREQDGTNVVLCHPGLVETGMNLIAWPEIVFAEPTYSLYRAMQARKRALRPTQTRPCNVTWLGYDDTMIAQALDIIGSKATAATLLNGDDLSSGLMQMDPGMSLLQELAQRVLRDDDVAHTGTAIATRLAAAGDALKSALEVGAHDLVGVTIDAVTRPDPTLVPAHPLPSEAPRPVPHPTAPALPLFATQPVVPHAAANGASPGLTNGNGAAMLSALPDLTTSADSANGNGASNGNGAGATNGTHERQVLTWREVIVRNRRNRRTSAGAASDEQETIQFSFVTD
jgi:hypothetical protein